MHNHHSNEQNYPKPLSAAKHFWLSFLAVVTGLPVAVMIAGMLSTIFTVFIIVILAISAGSGAKTSSVNGSLVYGSANARNVLVSVPINGVILSGSSVDPLLSIFGQGYTDGEQVKEKLMRLAQDNVASGVILEIDSPGGMVTASKAIADGVSYYKTHTGKPVYAHINGTGASGAYWVASTTDKILAEQGSEAGSIGVIMGPLVTLKGIVGYSGVTTTQPMSFKYFTAGKSKDLGNPYRDITPEEEAFLNDQVQAEYSKFVEVVSSHRNISADKIRNEIGALPYGVDSALKNQLIDGVSSKEEAYDALATAAGVAGSYRVEKISMVPSFWSGLFSAKSTFTSYFMSESDKSAARTRFCETSLVGKPLVFDGDISSVCK